MGFAQVQSPPGVDVVLSVRAGTLFPVAGMIPINSVVSKAKGIQRGLCGFPIDCQVISCRKNTYCKYSALVHFICLRTHRYLGAQILTSGSSVAIDFHFAECEHPL